MAKDKSSEMTIEDLAGKVNKGFAETQNVIDKRFDKMATKDELGEVKGIMKDMFQELNATHADVRYIRSTVEMLVHSDVAQDATIKDLNARVHRLEQKAGLAK